MDYADVADIYRIAFGRDASPDRWQQRFGSDEWPEILIAPTGSGKTAGVTLGWAAHRLHAPAATPRRLVWCLPMRTLAEQTFAEIRRWFHRLRTCDRTEGVLPKPEEVHLLMGGVEAARWLDQAERPAVIVGTQDMLLSRALMRGYASSRAIWPMEFALLHEDAQWVFDEVQLMGAGRATSAQLEAFRRLDAQRGEHAGRIRCPARSLWISATLKADWLQTVDFAPAKPAIRRVDPQTSQDSRVRRLATAKKTLTAQSDIAPASSKPTEVKAYLNQLARTVLDAHRPGRMTLVIVNRVRRAQDLRAALAKELTKNGTPPVLALVHGRFRPADRRRELDKAGIGSKQHGGTGDVIVVATQAVEAGVDISAAVMFTELAPWPSLVQRFGRANRYAELADGAEVRWIDLLAHARDDKAAEALALPYAAADLEDARRHLRALTDVAPVHLPPPGDLDPPQRVIRRKDLDDLFDTDPDLTGFDVDISPYVRDADDADVRVFWRDLSQLGGDPPRPEAEELCAVPVGGARDWLQKLRKAPTPAAHVFVRDPQWRREEPTESGPAGWTRLRDDPWPGLTLLAELAAGGYDEGSGFTGDPKQRPCPARPLPTGASETPHVLSADDGGEAEGHDEDPRSELGVPVLLSAHQRHVEAEAESLCEALGVDDETRAVIVRAARWHDVGKLHTVFQDTMRRGLGNCASADGEPLAKTAKSTRYERHYFRHELASALALLAHDAWSRSADLVSFLVAAHHGKVRMNLRALPREQAPPEGACTGARFARGVWEGDELPSLDLGGGERWAGGRLTLSAMELGWDETTHESWTERTRSLLTRFGPFRLAWMEALLRLADWRASAQERSGRGSE